MSLNAFGSYFYQLYFCYTLGRFYYFYIIKLSYRCQSNHNLKPANLAKLSDSFFQFCLQTVLINAFTVFSTRINERVGAGTRTLGDSIWVTYRNGDTFSFCVFTISSESIVSVCSVRTRVVWGEVKFHFRLLELFQRRNYCVIWVCAPFWFVVVGND